MHNEDIEEIEVIRMGSSLFFWRGMDLLGHIRRYRDSRHVVWWEIKIEHMPMDKLQYHRFDDFHEAYYALTRAIERG